MFDFEINGVVDRKTTACLNLWVKLGRELKLVSYLVDHPAFLEDGCYQITVEGIRFIRE